MKRETPRGPQPGDIVLLGQSIVLCHERHGARAKVLLTTGVLKGTKVSELDGPFGVSLSLSSSKSETTEKLVDFATSVNKAQEEVVVSDLWELLLEEDSEYTISDLSKLWFGEAKPSNDIAILRAIQASPAYFSKKNLHYKPKAQDKVEATLRDIESKRKKEELNQLAIKWFSSLMVGKAEPPWPEELSPFVQKLKNAAIDGRHKDSRDALTPILDALSLDGEFGPLTILIQLGIFQEDENLLLHRYRVPQSFSNELLAEAKALAQREGEEDEKERELVLEPAFAVDDADTRERDDALTIKKTEEGWVIGIHITDVSSWLEKGSPLDLEAQKRGATLYMPNENITMLPTTISHSILSLNPTCKRRALSVFATVDNEMNIVATRVGRTLIKMAEAITYEELLERTKSDEKLDFLTRFSEKLRAERAEAGARVDVTGDELKVRCIDGEIMVKKLNRACPARLMVSELMILANRTVASMLAENNVPCIYRTQAKVEVDADSILNRLSQAAIPKVQVSTQPAPHSTLGVSCYTQSTSPLRRYGDLLVQRQLSAFIQGQDIPYREDELNYLIDATEMATVNIRFIERWANRYWLYKYLTPLAGQALPAKVLEKRKDCCVIELTDYLLTLRFFPSPTNTYVKGDIIDVRLARVNPRRNQIRVEEPMTH